MSSPYAQLAFGHWFLWLFNGVSDKTRPGNSAERIAEILTMNIPGIPQKNISINEATHMITQGFLMKTFNLEKSCGRYRGIFIEK